MSRSTANTSLDKLRKHYERTGERRATDQLIKLWQSTTDKRIVVNSVSKSNLWKHCFLFVVDDELNCSVIIDRGDDAARGFAADPRGSMPLSGLRSGFARRLHGLGLQCRKKQTPAVDAYEAEGSADFPVKRYRMALVPLTTPETPFFLPRHEVMNMLGVFTYQ